MVFYPSRTSLYTPEFRAQHSPRISTTSSHVTMPTTRDSAGSSTSQQTSCLPLTLPEPPSQSVKVSSGQNGDISVPKHKRKGAEHHNGVQTATGPPIAIQSLDGTSVDYYSATSPRHFLCTVDHSFPRRDLKPVWKEFGINKEQREWIVSRAVLTIVDHIASNPTAEERFSSLVAKVASFWAENCAASAHDPRARELVNQFKIPGCNNICTNVVPTFSASNSHSQASPKPPLISGRDRTPSQGLHKPYRTASSRTTMPSTQTDPSVDQPAHRLSAPSMASKSTRFPLGNTPTTSQTSSKMSLPLTASDSMQNSQNLA